MLHARFTELQVRTLHNFNISFIKSDFFLRTGKTKSFEILSLYIYGPSLYFLSKDESEACRQKIYENMHCTIYEPATVWVIFKLENSKNKQTNTKTQQQ